MYATGLPRIARCIQAGGSELARAAEDLGPVPVWNDRFGLARVNEVAPVRLDLAEARMRFVAARVLRLATAGADGRPHVVPCTFAVDGSGRIVIGIDNKPKTSADLRRLRNIGENPRVSLLADHYADDWTQLWWVRADGIAALEDAGAEHAGHWELLRAKHPQYQGQILDGPVIVVTVERWSGWSYT